jgi:predicted GNAT family acetyltransferase
MGRPNVTISDNPDGSRLEALLDDGTVAGFADYKKRGSATYSFTHTEVDDELEGQGVGGRLATGIIEFARDNDVKILPNCEFLRSYMREHEDTHDVLAKGASLDEDSEERAS